MSDNEDDDQPLMISVPLRRIVGNIVDFYGTQQLLRLLIKVRKEHLAERIALYRSRGDDDVAECAEERGDPLMEGIQKLLDEGLY